MKNGRTSSRRRGRPRFDFERLEQRLAVLERIVTDRGVETADQIEALREHDAEQVR